VLDLNEPALILRNTVSAMGILLCLAVESKEVDKRALHFIINIEYVKRKTVRTYEVIAAVLERRVCLVQEKGLAALVLHREHGRTILR
jgi:hypothetical protein